MALKLNATREAYKEYSGRNTEQMPKLIADGRVPMNVAQLMQRRLDVRNSDADVKSSYLNNYFDTSDLNGQKGSEIKLVLTIYADGSITNLGRQYLNLINPMEELINGAVNLGVNERYENLQGEGVIITQRNKLAKIIGYQLTEQQANDSLFWRVMLRHPDEVPKEFAIPGLCKEAINYIFAEGNYNEAMGIFPSSAQGSTPELRAWFVGGLGYGSLAFGGDGLGNDCGRFVGIAPEALSAPGKGASNIKAYSMADLQAVDKAIKSLEGVLNPELLNPFTQLRKKL